MAATPAAATCTDNGGTTTLDCTGDLSTGVSATNGPYDTLNVTPSGDIAPVSGTAGISFTSTGGTGGTGGTGILTDPYGGTGGTGGTGGSLTLTYVGSTYTDTATNSHGIVAISRGGTGGTGGDGYGVVGYGGSGGTGGVGGTVSIDSQGAIVTSGDHAHGILAQSIGGNGGSGGGGYGAGGYGGTGGTSAGGGLVTVNSSSDITTNGAFSHGIFAESVGGAGGGGGPGYGVASGGGSGGSSSAGGDVSVINSGNITIQGVNSYGILAQSVGGFGGAGGSGGGLVGFGSGGASGSNGGGVEVSNSGTIITSLDGSHAIFAQSIGGGGGAGGSGAGLVGLGGGGSAGGGGGTLSVTNNGDGYIQTSGAASIGILAQSVGGGGGDGGSGSGLAGIGGSGSTTSPGGEVTVTNAQSITTGGARSNAILAQSVGGGGGNGGVSAGLIAIGGSGGGGGAGGAVTVGNTGALETTGVNSAALVAQSIGGGGGNGGNSVGIGVVLSLAIGGSGAVGGAADTVTVNPTVDVTTLTAADITTHDDLSNGITAQSVGGGGGNGGLAIAGSAGPGFSASVALGGGGGPGGGGSSVTVNYKGDITTGGEQSVGIFAQSVGGGGGNGGGSVAVTATDGYALSLAMGGKGGIAGDGSDVNVTSIGNITTSGAQAHGIVSQSVGGGGGNGGFAVAAGGGSITTGIALGASGAGGGSAGSATANASGGTIETSGLGAHAILVQSVGGGGGNGGFAGSFAVGAVGTGISIGGGGGQGGAGGTVTANNRADLITHQADAVGLLAQSVGGGGGNGGFALTGAGGILGVSVGIGGSGGPGGSAGTVTVNNDGDVTTTGNRSYGILAQSVGGGGGNGGWAIAAAVGVAVPAMELPGGAVSVAVGGKGGIAGDGLAVAVDNSGDITTGSTGDPTNANNGLGAHGILAQSIGGGGGSGGFAGAVSAVIGDGAAIGVSVGGSGGAGGNGGSVLVTNTGTIITRKDGASGIYAQSLGGGGGDGGFAFSVAMGGGGEEVNVNLAVAVGGAGGGGGTASTVTVHSNGDITTYGQQSFGVLAQSIGGGGGNGGFAVTGTFGISPRPNQIGVAVGGFGGDGATGGDVVVDNDHTITTSGKEAIGILAQSIGGSGGNGGISVAGSFGGTGEDSANLNVSIGGGGGTGNSAGTVTVTNNIGGAILTSGLDAHGIFAQSVGGGGGNGGLAVSGQLGKSGEGKTLIVGVTVGGAGGDGGFGNSVTVTNDATIHVTGSSAAGIFAQSAGGGGGNGGGAFTGIGQVTETSDLNPDAQTVSITVAVGGGGGDGNHGGTVTVTNTGSITTEGSAGYGIFAQSVGGGGGIGGRANTLNLQVANKCALPVLCTEPKPSANNIALGVTVGGNGGGASNGAKVMVTNNGTIETYGDTAAGIFAQSVGGGGGVGGNGHLGTGEVLPVPAELILIPVIQSGILKTLNAVVGGSAGSSGDGGEVEVVNHKNITTHGATDETDPAHPVVKGGAFGILAQSIGGGGGVGGLADIGATGTLGIGGAGGAAGNGGKVTVTSDANSVIETFGIGSTGIYAQSVGGGGGIAGAINRALPAGAGPIPALNLGIGLALGRSGGGGGNGGEVDVDVTGTIRTHGEKAHGIFAQSVGGGGGELGTLGNDIPVLDLLSWHIGSVGGAGSAGNVTVNLDGSIQTSGNNAQGIVAQSAGGTGTAGNVTITLHSTIETAAILGPEDGTAASPLRGLGSIGILAQSLGGGGNGDVTITVGDTGETTALVRGGRTDSAANQVGVGIWIMDGKNNTVTNNGTVTTAGGALAGFAIMGGSANETVQNHGVVTGSFDLGDGSNSFVNNSGAVLNSGVVAKVGADNTIADSGYFSPGALRQVLTTMVTGNWTQNSTGVYRADLDLFQTGVPGLEADRINLSGAADLTGGVSISILHAGNALPGSHQVTIVSADGQLSPATASSLTLAAPASAVATYQLLFPWTSDPTPVQKDVVLSYAIDFAPAGLNRNQTAVGNNINEILLTLPRDNPDTAISPLIDALFSAPDLPSLKLAYDIISPEVYAENKLASLYSSLDFSNALLSCRVRDGQFRFVDEGNCVWSRGGYRGMSRNETDENRSFTEQAAAVAAGVQHGLADRFTVGFGVSNEFSRLKTGVGATSDGNLTQAGVVAKGRQDGTTISFALTGGYGRYDTRRMVDFGNLNEVAEGTQTLAYGAAHLRAAQLIGGNSLYLRPAVDFGAVYQVMGAFEETGSNVVGLSIQRDTQNYFTIAPSLEIGGEFVMSDVKARPFARIGLIQFFGDDPQATALFQQAPVGVTPFTVNDVFAPTAGEVVLGMDILAANGAVLRLDGMYQRSSNVSAYGGNLKLSVPIH